MPKMSLRSSLLVTVAAAAFIAVPMPAAAPTFAAEQAAPAAQTPPAIRVVAAERRELVETLTLTGTVLPRQEAAAGTDLGGLTVMALNADQGDRVTRGQVLAVVDRAALDVQLAQAEASRAQAEAAVAQAEAQIGDARIGVRQASEALERARALQAKGVATQSQLDSAVNSFDSAGARLTTAERARDAAAAQLGVIDAQKRAVLLQLSKTEIKAPADGLVLSRSATLGGIVSAANGPLFRIAIGAEFEVAATVAEMELPRLVAGMPVSVTASGSAVAVDGTIRLIAPEINQTTRLGSLRIALDKDATIRSGGFARAEVVLARRTGVAVPAAALVYRGDEPFLQLVEDGTVRTVPVEVGVRDADQVEILSGLAEGQEVVARAGTFVADGDRVTPVRDDRTGALAR
jgi:HlyD family secretion protein